MATSSDYNKAVLEAVTKKYQDAQKAGAAALRNTLAGLKRGIETLVSDSQYQTLALPEARKQVSQYITNFDYSLLEEEHPECARDFKDYLGMLEVATKSEDLSALEKLVK